MSSYCIMDVDIKWYKEGTLPGEFIYHREDGPAIEYWNGDKFWYIDGRLHHSDGPAIELTNGHKEWWINGKLHRLDGPAIEGVNGNKYWYINGKLYFEEEYYRLIKLKAFA